MCGCVPRGAAACRAPEEMSEGSSSVIDMNTLHVDCGTCQARGPACSDCVISVLLGAPEEGVDLDPEEQGALSALAESGVLPPLRLVTPVAATEGWEMYG